MATLEFLTGKLKGKTEEVGEGSTLIGKSRSSGISVRDLGVSFKHAEITFADGKYLIEDLKSKKGTFVNDTQVEAGAKVEIPDGATVKLGDTEARFSVAGAPAPVADAPAESAPAAVADAATVDAAPAEEAKPEKKLSARERIALRRKQRAEKAAKAAGEKAAEEVKAAGGDEVAAAVVAEKEEEANKAVREVVQLRRKLKEAEEKIAALRSGGEAVEAEAQMEAIQRELAEKDQMVENLELALSEARAGIGAGDGSSDERVQKLEAELASSQEDAIKQKTEAKKLQKALERQAEEVERLKEQASGGGAGGYSGAEEENEQLREALNEKTMAMDSMQAEYMEQKELIEKYQRRIDDYNKDQGSRRSTAEKQVEAMEDKIGEYLEQKHSAEKELQRFKKDYEQFEERVIELQASVDDLTERNDIMQYKLEQAEQKVGEIVRGKLMEMQQKAEEVQQANEQLQSLVEAYEEKIDEMDTRIEELEAETEELEKLLEEEREAHEKTKQEAAQNERALRKRLQLAVGGESEAGAEEPVEVEGVTA